MSFPETPLEFLKSYEFKDKEKIYTNGSMLIPTFRVKQMIEHYFNSIPIEDEQEVRHGKWTEKPYLLGISNLCSLCGENFGMPHGKFNYCPHCGAKMDK